MTFSSLTLPKDEDFGDSRLDVSVSDKRLVRVTTNTYKNSSGTHIHIKLFKKKDDQGEFHLQQRVGLTVKEFQDLVANVENIKTGPIVSGDVIDEKKSNKRNAQINVDISETKRQRNADKKN